MLIITHKFIRTIQKIFALLFIISSITFHNSVFAESKEKIAEEYRLKGYAEHQKGNLDDAITFYNKAIALGLRNSVVLNDMGILYEQIGFYSKAENFYLKAVDVDKFYLPAYMNLAYLYLQNGYEQKAAQYFQLRYELGEPDELWAKKAKDELLKIKPEFRKIIVQIEANKLKDEIVAKVHKDFYERVKLANEHFLRGKDHSGQGRYEKALGEFNHALSLTPENPKFVKARREVIVEMTKENIRERTDQAIKMLDLGDSTSARYEIQKMLTTIPKER